MGVNVSGQVGTGGGAATWCSLWSSPRPALRAGSGQDSKAGVRRRAVRVLSAAKLVLGELILRTANARRGRSCSALFAQEETEAREDA